MAKHVHDGVNDSVDCIIPTLYVETYSYVVESHRAIIEAVVSVAQYSTGTNTQYDSALEGTIRLHPGVIGSLSLASNHFTGLIRALEPEPKVK